MISIDEMEQMLGEFADQLPEEFFTDLNGGILLLPDVKLHHGRVKDDLYIMGEYHRSRAMGRYIVIYYGSFKQVYGHASDKKLKAKLEATLKHEFTHHLESLGGQRDLAIEDDRRMARYLQRHARRGR